MQHSIAIYFTETTEKEKIRMNKTNSLAKKRGLHRLTAGWASWRWIAGASSKEKMWLLGVISKRGGYESWMTHLPKGLQDSCFLLTFERTTDSWERSKLVGQKISELRKSYLALTEGQRDELARQAEVELRTGLEMMRAQRQENHSRTYSAS
jgi:hypothetical protein